MFKSKNFIILLLTLSGLTQLRCTTQNEEKNDPEIHSLLENYYQTFSDRDWQAYKDFFWEKGTLTTVWQQEGDSIPSVQVSTIDEFIEQAHLGPGSQPVFEETMTKASITVKGNLAVAWVNYNARFGTEDRLTEWSGLDVFTLMKHEGKWGIVSLAFSQD